MPALSSSATLERTGTAAGEWPIAREASRTCVFMDLGQIEYGAAWRMQQDLVWRRKQGLIPDHLLFAEHPHVITLGRGSRREHVLASEQQLERIGITVSETNRGGDVTYHGPGQLIGYPIVDLREWKRDVVAYLRALEQVLIDALGEFGVKAERFPGYTGVWAGGAKVAAMGVHVSRWVTSHGFALNRTTDLSYFGYIVPCGLAKPVTSMQQLLGEAPPRSAVIDALVRHFGRVFGRGMQGAGGLDSCDSASEPGLSGVIVRPPGDEYS